MYTKKRCLYTYNIEVGSPRGRACLAQVLEEEKAEEEGGAEHSTRVDIETLDSDAAMGISDACGYIQPNFHFAF